MPLPQATCTFSHKIKAHVSGSFGLPAEFFQEGSRIMKELKSPPRNAARAGGVAAWSMATALSLALVLGLAPAQALALPQEDAPALEQTSPAGEPGEQDGAAAVESADAPESPEASESPEGSTEDNGAAAAEEPSTPADAAGQGTGEASSPEGVATVLGSSSTGLALSDGGYYELADISFSGTVILKITEAGTYTFHGSRPNTQIQVDTGKDEPVTIVLNAVTIDNSGHDLSAISIEGGFASRDPQRQWHPDPFDRRRRELLERPCGRRRLCEFRRGCEVRLRRQHRRLWSRRGRHHAGQACRRHRRRRLGALRLRPDHDRVWLQH